MYCSPDSPFQEQKTGGRGVPGAMRSECSSSGCKVPVLRSGRACCGRAKYRIPAPHSI